MPHLPLDCMSPIAPPITVSQLTRAIKLNLESSFPLVHVQGELSNVKQQPSGHLYFSLKDAHAQLNAVMFRGDASLLSPFPRGGEQVIVTGELNVYPPKGQYQMVVRTLTYTGVGELLQRLEVLKRKLHQLGWFKTTRKRPLPPFPQRIGVVTSATGAVIQDIVHILTRRAPSFSLILNPVRVQGEGAAHEIAQAIEDMNRYQLADVLIVGRGGGSLEDLWAFNEEIVAQAIYGSHIPIISAVGHETDHCIADYVADLRAPTPSAAAELVTRERKQLIDHVITHHTHIHRRMAQLIGYYRHSLKGYCAHPLFQRPTSLLEGHAQRLDDLRYQLYLAYRHVLLLKRHALDVLQQKTQAAKPHQQITRLRERLGTLTQTISQQMQQQLDKRSHRVTTLVQLLHAVDPRRLLAQGYSILLAEKKPIVIQSVRGVQKGDRVRLLLSDGTLLLTVQEVETREHVHSSTCI